MNNHKLAYFGGGRVVSACRRSCYCHFDQERFCTYFERAIPALYWLATMFAHLQNPRVFRTEMEDSDKFKEDLHTEMQSFATVRSVFLWAQLKGDPLQALLNRLGVEVVDHPRVLAAVSESDWGGAIAVFALAKPATPAQKAKTVVARGAAVLTITGRLVSKQVPVAPSSAVMEVRSIRGLFYLRLRDFGDRLVLVGRFRLIMLYFACGEYVNFDFFVSFSGSVDAFFLWDPGGNVNGRSSRMARGSLHLQPGQVCSCRSILVCLGC